MTASSLTSISHFDEEIRTRRQKGVDSRHDAECGAVRALPREHLQNGGTPASMESWTRCPHRYFFFFLRFLLGPPGSGGACGLPSTRGGGVACAACGATAGGMDPGVVSGACCEACHSSLSLRLLGFALRSSYFLGFFPPFFWATG